MFIIPDPDLQVDFFSKLGLLRGKFLQEALKASVRSLNIAALDRELASVVPATDLAALASFGLRAELVFATPLLLRTSPQLIGYYRLLYGYSQKEFYTTATGLSRFKRLEESNALPPELSSQLDSLCGALAGAGSLLLGGFGAAPVSAPLLADLTLLTLGPQLRGGANVKRGTAGIAKVFDAIRVIVEPAIKDLSPRRIEIVNAAGRTVLIEFSADPDIVVREKMTDDSFRQMVAIEVKAGSDFSNIHNRIGEAEKSHQKARASGFVECWTVVNVDRIDMNVAKSESPSTNRFYRVSDLVSQSGPDYQDFRSRIVSQTGIKS